LGNVSDDRAQYRRIIDTLVYECRDGQGPILPTWVRRGVWNRHAVDHPDDLPEEARYNELLARLSEADRDLVARMLQDAFEAGVQTSLRVLHDEALAPFDDGYEGTPFHDFVGRLADSSWPISD
jgi:uncharacterized protein DUF6547